MAQIHTQNSKENHLFGRLLVAQILVNNSTDQYIVGIPQNNACFHDGSNYWVFYLSSGTLNCLYGSSLAAMSSAGSTGIANIENSGRQYSILFGTIAGTWYAWCVYGNTTEFYGVRRWELTGAGLGTPTDQNSAITDKADAHVCAINDYGSSDVTNVFAAMSGPVADANIAVRATAGNMASNTGMNAYNPSAITFPEHAAAMKLSDGFITIAMDNGNTGEQNGNFGHCREVTKTNIGDAWGTESTIEGNVTGATANNGDFTDQNYGINTSHAGQQDICQLDSGEIYAAYCANGDLTNGDYGEIKLVKRGNAKASGWTLVSNDLIGAGGEAWHLAMTTDGTDVWIFYCKNNAGVRDSSIYYKKYNVAAGSFGTETKLADIQASYTFVRMFTQWRADNGKIVVSWSETDGAGNYDLVAEEVSVVTEISVVGSSSTYSYNAISALIDLTPEITVTGGTASYSYNAINASIELTSEIIVTGQTASYSYSSVNAAIELAGIISVIGQTAAYTYSAVNASVELAGDIAISGQTSTYSYTAINATITFPTDIFSYADDAITIVLIGDYITKVTYN
jgi:hypothetical protein